jgi:hypothetical protein
MEMLLLLFPNKEYKPFEISELIEGLPAPEFWNSG